MGRPEEYSPTAVFSIFTLVPPLSLSLSLRFRRFVALFPIRLLRISSSALPLRSPLLFALAPFWAERVSAPRES